MKPEEITNKKVLLSVLNWGMGHVSRCIPIIDQLIQQGNELFIAGNQHQLAVFSQYSPQINPIIHVDYPFEFNQKGNFRLDLLKSSISLFKQYKKEQNKVSELVDLYTIDIVISDHRYGFFSKKVFSIFITHQLHLPLSFVEKPFQLLHRKLISNFNETWVLDTDDSFFGGNLSRSVNGIKLAYIGLKSRFSLYNTNLEKEIDQLVIVSGPMPHSLIFYNKMKNLHPDATFIVPPSLGLVSKSERLIVSNDWKTCDQLILSAKEIISRSGYSTIMDVYYLNVRSNLFPTLGQSEQHYLSQLHKKSLSEI